MKINIYLVSTFLGLFFLLSCSSKDDIPVPDDELSYWGYFKGEINGEEVKLENAKDESLRPISSMGTNIRDFGEASDSIRGMITKINLLGNTSINITLFPLNKGVRHITRWAKGDWNQDGIHIQKSGINLEEDDENIYYTPKTGKPFKVEIINSTYADRWHPTIEVKLDGVLYRADNSKDSIIVKGTYGTEPN